MTQQAQVELLARVRGLLEPGASVREVAMFGGRAVMVNGKMIVSAGKQGDLLVRVSASRHDELVARPGARQAQMGAGREMGPGWISVAAASLEHDEQLALWIAAAMEQNRAATGRSST